VLKPPHFTKSPFPFSKQIDNQVEQVQNPNNFTQHTKHVLSDFVYVFVFVLSEAPQQPQILSVVIAFVSTIVFVELILLFVEVAFFVVTCCPKSNLSRRFSRNL